MDGDVVWGLLACLWGLLIALHICLGIIRFWREIWEVALVGVCILVMLGGFGLLIFSSAPESLTIMLLVAILGALLARDGATR
jgi:hypothetical protein